MKNVVGFVPAGGKGMRMKPFKLMKELLPVMIDNENQETEVSLLIENAVNVLHKGGIKNVVCTVNHDKEILVKILSDMGADYSDMKFPDTIIYPLNCFDELYAFHCEKKSDLTLGVFPTNNARNLGPVVIGPDNKVERLEDKPENPSADNTWNVLIWEDSFLDLLMSEVESYRNDEIARKKELKIYDIMLKAIEEKLSVSAYLFESGKCIDISCIQDARVHWNHQSSSK